MEPSLDLDSQPYRDRKELVDHLDWVIRPPLAGWFVDQIAEVIALAADGKDDTIIEVGLKYHSVKEAVELWELQELVDRAKAGEFGPRRGNRTWVRD